MIKVFEPNISFKNKISVINSLNKNYISGNSPVIEKFENKIAMKFDRKFCVAISNGTVALDIAIKSLNLPDKSEIVIPSFTIISCLSAVLRAGCKPVFCDVDLNSYNVTLENIKKVVTRNTKAILLVHTYGLVGEVNKILDFCKQNNLMVIEDAAESHGIKVNGKACGSFGDISVLSFYANKHITTGEGGAILCDSQEKYNLIKRMINLDFTEPNRFNHENFYWNYRMSGVQASLGISQVDELDKTIKFKKLQGENYHFLLSDLSEFIQLPLKRINGVDNHYWVYGILLNKQFSRDKVRNFLFQKQIETRDFFWPLHLQKAYLNQYPNNLTSLPNSEYLGNFGFYIPIGKHVKFKDQKYISTQVREAIIASQL